MTPRVGNGSPHDDHLRARFEALRRADHGGVPDLDALLARPRARINRPLVRAAWLAAAAITAAVVGLKILTRETRGPGGSVMPPNTPSIVTWQSPTASLLDTPEQSLLRTVPTLRSSLLQSVPLPSLVTRHPGA